MITSPHADFSGCFCSLYCRYSFIHKHQGHANVYAKSSSFNDFLNRILHKKLVSFCIGNVSLTISVYALYMASCDNHVWVCLSVFCQQNGLYHFRYFCLVNTVQILEMISLLELSITLSRYLRYFNYS